MSSKFELEQWVKACEAFDKSDYDEALKTFISIADNAKMHFNIGSIFTNSNDHRRAITAFSQAIARDPYFAVAYFQRGVSFFILGDLESAESDFDMAYQRLRGNSIINYQQLGLQFLLYRCEISFNWGICQLYLGKIDSGLTHLYHAQKGKETGEHDIIDQAIRARGRGFSVYSLPPGSLFRPSEIRLRQLKGLNIFRDKLPLPIVVLPDVKNSTIPSVEQDAYYEDFSPPLYPTHSNDTLPPSPLSSRGSSRRMMENGFFDSNLTLNEQQHHCQATIDRYNKTSRPQSIKSNSSSQLSFHSHASNSASCFKKLKIKCHYQDTRILLTSTDINFKELKSRIAEKFDTNPASIQLSYEDEEQEKVLLVDDEDLEMARQINQARLVTPTTIEKLEIWL